MSTCLFCQIVAGELPAVIVYQDECCVVIMDIFALNPGHLLIIPRQHGEFCEDLPAQILTKTLATVCLMGKALLTSSLGVQAYHVLLNNGKAANQHIQHVHYHVVPRYGKDGWGLLWRFLTRFINPLNRIGREQRLQKQAEIIRLRIAEITSNAN